MKRYALIGRPVDSALLAPYAVGSVLDLDLNSDEEAALVAAGALKVLPGPKPAPEKKAVSDGPAKQDS